MTKPRASSTATTWLATSGLIAGASVVGVVATAVPAGARAALPSSCPAGSYLIATRVCELFVEGSSTVTLPSSVKALQILTVGAGGGGGGGTTYAPGGGGGGGQVRVCNVSIADLSHVLTITEGAGGTGGADGAGNIYNSSYGAEYGDAGSNGGATSVSNGSVLCNAEGGQGGQPGNKNFLTDLPDPSTYGAGGDSGSGIDGGSGANLQVGNSSADCLPDSWVYNIVAAGGGGAQAGQTPSSSAIGSISGAGGDGESVTSGMFSTIEPTLGGGGGGGGGSDCQGTTTGGDGGTGGGGAGANAATIDLTPNVSPRDVGTSPATAGTDFTGGGGGGGGGTDLSADNTDHGVGTPGADGGSGAVYLAFAEPTVNTNAYFATASSQLTTADKAALKAFAATAVADNMASVTIDGYADPRGTAPSNLKLSQARADATEKYLAQQFAQADFTISVTAVGKGATSKFGSLAKDRVATVTAQGGTVSQL